MGGMESAVGLHESWSVKRQPPHYHFWASMEGVLGLTGGRERGAEPLFLAFLLLWTKDFWLPKFRLKSQHSMVWCQHVGFWEVTGHGEKPSQLGSVPL
jgi:hypothetical protein